ncbi:MAG: sigma-54 dependent transcriptional regulator, partial [candidate division Zixibacteria bacterium]
DPRRIPSILKDDQFDVILLDMNFTENVSGGQEGFLWLNKILEIDPEAVVVLITAYGDVDIAVRAIKEGATDFVLKPWQNEKLWATISAAMNLRRTRNEADSLRQRQKQLSADLDQPFHDFVGESPSMRRVFQTIKKVAATDASVLILGENGTGKELVARAIHRQSQRSDEVFISVDIGAISDTLFESELFGHVKGSFTDAREDRAGRFETAHNGSLFLDEIGNLPLVLQSKLLAVLENRKVTRLGSNTPKPIDIRLISATNMPVHRLVAEGTFRQDLLYRINTVEIHLPPLRERDGDIPLLANRFMNLYARKYSKSIKRLDDSALDLLSNYFWPGNVRELQHALERAVIMASSATLRRDDFVLSPSAPGTDEASDSNGNLEQLEKTAILRSLDKHLGNVSHAARELGLTRASLYRRLRKYDL